MLLARLVRLLTRPRAITTRVTRFHAWLLRRSGGRLRRSWLFALGQPVLAITTTGRRSGRPRSTTVAYFEDAGRLVTTAANLGNERDPAWAVNLDAHPEATIAVGGRSRRVRAERAQGEEHERLWARWVELQPAARRLPEVAGRQIPVFVLTPLEDSPPR